MPFRRAALARGRPLCYGTGSAAAFPAARPRRTITQRNVHRDYLDAGQTRGPGLPRLRSMTAGMGDEPTTAQAAGVVFPPVVYVPCAPVRPESGEIDVDLRMTRDGRLALLVYSALDRLVTHCGPAQPWTLMRASDLEQVRLETGFELVLLDLDIPAELRRTEGEL